MLNLQGLSRFRNSKQHRTSGWETIALSPELRERCGDDTAAKWVVHTEVSPQFRCLGDNDHDASNA